MVEAKRKKGETFESFLRRFNKRVIQSGKLLQARKIRFFAKSSSRMKQKGVALQKAKLAKKYDYLKKIGKIEDRQSRGGRRR